MLASITPLGERGRHNRWGITVAAFLLGAGGAGVLLGTMLGLLGSQIVRPGSAGLVVLALLLAAAAASDLVLDPAPGPRRQVEEGWLDSYRGWVYGLGYGAQMGAGVLTVVTSASTYVVPVAAFLSGSPAGGAVVAGLYGTLRGLTPLLARDVHAPGELMALHRALQRLRGPVAGAAVVVLAAGAVAALVAELA